MDQKRLPAGARDKLPFWFPAAWSTRAVALSMQMTMAGFMTVYFTDVLGLNPAIIGLLLMISRFSDAITDLLIGFIVDRTNTKLGKARPYEFAIVVLWATIYAIYAAPEMSKTALYVWVFVTYFMMNIYLFECMDYGEWKLGTRIEGVMGSVNSFMAKMASALSGALQGFLIAAIGYVGTKEVQSASTLTGITVLYNLVPLVLVLVALFISYKYNVEKKIGQIRKELEARKHENAVAVAEEAAEKEWETWRS